MGLDGFHALLSALSTSARDDSKEGLDESTASASSAAAAASLHPKFTAGSLMPLPNNLPRLVQIKGRRGDNK